MLQQANITGGKGEGFLNNILIIYPTDTIESKVEDLYNQREHNPEATDRLLDELFCNLYGLTEEEKQYIFK